MSITERSKTRRIEQSRSTDTIDAYQKIVEAIGEGTYSSVDLYENPRSSSGIPTLFAVKSISFTSLRSTQIAVYGPSGLVDVHSGKFQLDREIDILSKLSLWKNVHIISIHEILFEESVIHIVYPYRGVPVMVYANWHGAYSASTESRVDKFKVVSVGESDRIHVLRIEDATECMRQLLDAVAAVHAAGVCHKDIKPENVLIQTPFSRWWSRSKLDPPSHYHDFPDPSPIHITLCDFNTAEFTQDGGQIFDAQGTVLFSPPEVFNRAFSDEQSIAGYPRDIWSVGMVGFALLCGTLSLVGKTPLEIQLELINLIHENPDGNLSLPCDWESIPGDAPIKAIIESMLSIDPHSRPSAAQALDSLK